MTAVGPDATKTVGFSLGTFNPTLNICTGQLRQSGGGCRAANLNAVASTTGFYCVRMYDNGSVAAAVADGSATTFTQRH